MATAATATFKDTYAGNVDAQLVSFRTKVRGQSETRFRWEQTNGQGCGFVPGGFATVARAVAAARGSAKFFSVVSQVAA
jgi:hypothetical protein